MKLALIAVSIGVLVLLSACAGGPKTAAGAVPATPSSATAESQADSLQPLPVELATLKGIPSISGFLQAVILGEKLDQKHGITIQPYESASPANLEQALVLGDVDVGFVAPLTVARLNAEKGKDFVFFSNFALNQIGWSVKPSATYATPRDLKGKKVCTYAPGTASYTSSKLMVALMGLDLEKDYSLVSGEPAFCLAALERGDVEAAALHEPLATNLIAQGKLRSLVFVSDEIQKLGGMMLPGNNNIAASRSWVEKNPKAAKRLDRMYLEAVDFVLNNPGLVLERYGKDAGLEPGISLELARANFLKVFTPSSQAAEMVASYDKMVERSLEFGLLTKKPEQPLALSLK